MKDINLNLSTEEANTLLEALGNMPYVKVFQIIDKIQQQASAQMSPSDDKPKNGEVKGKEKKVAEAEVKTN